jgi:hypothetical protein
MSFKRLGSLRCNSNEGGRPRLPSMIARTTLREPDMTHNTSERSVEGSLYSSAIEQALHGCYLHSVQMIVGNACLVGR